MTPRQAVRMHFFQKRYNIKRVNRFGIRRSKCENIWIGYFWIRVETISYLNQIAIVNSVWFLCSFWENISSTLSSYKIYKFKFWKNCLICFHFAGYPQKLEILTKKSFQVGLHLVCFFQHFYFIQIPISWIVNS